MARMSFLMKGIYFIVILMVIAIVINQIVTLNLRNIEQWESVSLRDKSKNILETLAGNKNCLAYEEVAEIEGTEVNLTSHKIVDINKLNDFVDNFGELEPNCVRDFEYGYRVKVETFPIDMKTEAFPEEGSVFSRVKKLINGEKVVFLVDVSGSMGTDGGECDVDVDPDYPDKKICCLKKFMIAFINGMEDESMITIVPYGDENECDPVELFPFTELEGNRDMMIGNVTEFIPIDGTPMCKALEKGFQLGSGDADAIVLLTDGCENKCCEREKSQDVAQEYKDMGIPVYTIAYGFQACPQPLKEIARITNGEYFDARKCEELIPGPEPLDIIIPSESWSFGDSAFSREDALEESVKVSIPVIISYNSTISVPGKMTITLVEGELERLVGFIEKSCLTERSSTTSLYLHYPTHLETENEESKICMEVEGKKRCQTLACKKEIDFHGNEVSGNYKIYSRLEDDKLKIVI